MKVDVSKLKPGDIVQHMPTFRVLRKDADWVYVREIKANGDLGPELKYSHSIVEGMCSTDQFEDTKTVTATELAKVLNETGDMVYSCVFTKKPDAKRAAELLDGADVSTKPKRFKLAHQLLTGDEREIHCVNSRQGELGSDGRHSVRDLKQAEGERNNKRLVDPRTATSVTFNGTCYKLKK